MQRTQLFPISAEELPVYTSIAWVQGMQMEGVFVNRDLSFVD